jgi:exopolyphosphatase/guanosine-5'-triphosphate,3'-diphosphate pyrophosphatase
MRIAILDLGTNTFNILIVELREDRSYETLFQNKLSVKLGEGGINDRIIREIPFQRGIDALKMHRLSIETHNTDKIYAFATSAIRDAQNGMDFVRAVKEELGFEIDVITGDEEAQLIYYGVREAVEMSAEKSLIIDIGGGSTEFIIADRDRIYWKHSFPLGAARILDKFRPDDPIRPEQIEEIRSHLNDLLAPLTKKMTEYNIIELIGSSGSFDSLAEMIAHRFYTPEILEGKTEFDYDLEHCRILYDEIIKTDREQRLRIPGLIEMRVDMIVVSSIIVHFVLSKYKIKKMRLSTFALKEGVLFRLLRNR